MAGELKKPDLVHTLYPDEIQEKIWHLPVRELYMVGKVTAEVLNGQGIMTIGQLACTDPKMLRKLLGKRGDLIWNYANGIEKHPVQQCAGTKAKGISHATTFRQLGVSATDLCSGDQVQLTLEDPGTKKQEQLDQMIDHIRHKYGENAIIRSALLPRE